MAYTDDGWGLPITRFQTIPFQVRELGAKSPVLLLHGLSSNMRCFDLDVRVSLARYLAARGWDTWCIELRGAGKSRPPKTSCSSCAPPWTVDDHLHKDLPTALQYISELSQQPKVHAVGHSMGGMLLCGMLTQAPAYAQRTLASVTLLCSACHLEKSEWAKFSCLITMMSCLKCVPARILQQTYSIFTRSFCACRPLDRTFFCPQNTQATMARKLMRHNFENISSGVLRQLQSAFKPDGLQNSKGTQLYADPKALAQVRTPVLCIAGDHDVQCPSPAVEQLFMLFGSPHKQLVELGPKAGHQHHYGHFDALMGRNCVMEVYPILTKWFSTVELEPAS